MRHALVYHGSYESNFSRLTADSSTFEGSDGAPHTAAPWPAGATGLRVTYMERAGKRFCAVRVADADGTVTLAHDVELQAGRHYGFGARLSGDPTLVEDDVAMLVLLDDIIRCNGAVREALMPLRERLRGGMPKRPGPAAT